MWIINYCILEMKADNEPAISLLIYFKSVKKTKYVSRKNNNNNNKRAKIKSFQWQESNPRPPTCKVSALSIVPWQLITKNFVKWIVFNTFAHEVQPVNALRSRRRALFMKNWKMYSTKTSMVLTVKALL